MFCVAQSQAMLSAMKPETTRRRLPGTSLRRVLLTGVSAVIAMPLLIASTPAAAERPALPRVSAALPVTASSRPFLSAAHQQKPVDLAALGYVEEEYFVSGRARIYDWPERDHPQVKAEGPYTTRILVRRPVRRAHFSGTVIVEPLNPSMNFDAPIMWAQSWKQFVKDGHAWVGITIKPNTISALKAFDPQRYASVAMPNPPGAPGCAAERINPLSLPGGTATQTGLAWDMLAQIGLRLKSTAPGSPLPWPARRLYMTGQSQTAAYARTFATLFGRSVVGPDGSPLYDAYLYSGGPPWQVPLHQCLEDLAAGDPRLITPAVGVPVIELFAEGDLVTNVESRRPDADTAADRFRRYEVAGAAHTDPWEELSFPTPEDRRRAGLRDTGESARRCEPTDVMGSDFPIRYAFNVAWRHLDRWVTRGIAPPHARPLELKPRNGSFLPAQAFVTDELGNARGGVRLPQIDVATARYVGGKTGPFSCQFSGYQFPLSAVQRAARYPEAGSYLKQLRRSAEALVREGWLTREDRDEILRDAAAAPLP
jgi:hypothetical protein